jgi:uncharacterized protein (TIGR00645 family)
MRLADSRRRDAYLEERLLSLFFFCLPTDGGFYMTHENPQPPKEPEDREMPAAGKRGINKLEGYLAGLDWVIYESRWLLMPINLGLVAILCAYVANSVWHDLHLLREAMTSSPESLGVLALGALDAAMVANLMVMIIKGSHQIFIRRFPNTGPNKPQWLDHIDSGLLKIKVAQSIASITLVDLLKDFVNIEDMHWDIIVHRMYIHAMCLVSALVMAIIWRLTHSDSGTHHANGNSAHGASQPKGDGSHAAASAEHH